MNPVENKIKDAIDQMHKAKNQFTQSYWRGYADALIYAQENLIPKKKEKKIRDRPKNYKIVYEDRWKTEEIFCESLKRAEKIAERMTKYNKSARAIISTVKSENQK
jgi:hypothetical protein